MNKTKLKELIIKSLKEFECEAIYLFGSFVEDRMREDSDIDIAFLSYKEFDSYTVLKKSTEISEIIGYDIDLVDLNKSSTVFQNQVVRSGLRIYERNKIDIEKFEILVLKKYMELNILREDIINDYSNNIKELIKKMELD